MMQYYPWQTAEWKTLQTSESSGRLAHAYLLEGLPGLGKLDFAKAFAYWMLCEQRHDNAACGECRSCSLLNAGSHPDFTLVMPEEEGKMIRVDWIRELNELVITTPQVAARRVVIISPAEAMNRAAANALLKTLEEPPGETFFLLVSSALEKLLPTIRSRCQWLHFSAPDRQQALEWLTLQTMRTNDCERALQLSGGAPLLALNLLESDGLSKREAWFNAWLDWQQDRLSFSKLVADWKSDSLAEILTQLASWLADMLRLLSAGQQAILRNQDFAVALTRLAEGLTMTQVMRAYELVLKKRALLRGAISVNAQLQLEEVLIQWLSVIHQRGK